MSRVAAIDCGTNSIRLLIADALDGQLRDVHRETRIVRLGQGVDATGRFAPEALQRTRSALVDYAALCTSHGVDRIRMVATSATRDAGNRDVFFAMTADVLGDVVEGAVAEVITGVEEAELSFRGAVNELDYAAAPFVIVDLGGGSTEVVLGADTVVASFSADIGCVRLTERCLHSDPPTAAEVAAAREVVRERLGEALRVVPVEEARTWVGVAGTMTTIAALAQDMTTYDSAAIHLSRVGMDRLLAVCDGLIGMSRAQRAALGPMHEGRVDVIGGGAIVIEELAFALRERAGIDALTVSEHDILDGIALSIARKAAYPNGRCLIEISSRRFFCSLYSSSVRCPWSRCLAISRIAAATPVTTVRGAGDASISPPAAAPATRGVKRAWVTGLPLSCLASAAGGPAMAWPAIPPSPIWLNVFAESSDGAAAAGPASVSGDVIAMERISGAATVHPDGTDNPPIMLASPMPADTGTVPEGRFVRGARKGLNGVGPTSGQPTSPFQPLMMSSWL